MSGHVPISTDKYHFGIGAAHFWWNKRSRILSDCSRFHSDSIQIPFIALPQALRASKREKRDKRERGRETEREREEREEIEERERKTRESERPQK